MNPGLYIYRRVAKLALCLHIFPTIFFNLNAESTKNNLFSKIRNKTSEYVDLNFQSLIF